MAIYSVYAAVSGSKYIGDFEADNEDLAIAKAMESGNAHIGLCHQCAKQCEDAEAKDFIAEEIKP